MRWVSIPYLYIGGTKYRLLLYIGNMKSINERLRSSRKAARLSQGQVATFEGMSQQYLSDLERGVNNPPAWPLLASLARRYRTSADYLLGLTDDPSPRRTQLGPDEAALLELWRGLSPPRQADVMGIVQMWTSDELERTENLAAAAALHGEIQAALVMRHGEALGAALYAALMAGDMAGLLNLTQDAGESG
jgi:transcriptional regulator with XRE-family HTH domain